MVLEVCAYNIQSCFIAEKAGAGRIELCADPAQGGTTPSYGTITYAIEHVSIPIFPMIRPRGGNFIYDKDEMAIMKEDILMCRELGCPGIATGALLPDGQIDVEHLKQIVEWAHPMVVTCHKAFDRTPDAYRALEAVIEAGCSRVLTSGLQATAMEGADTIARLVTQAGDRIIIMPGGSVRLSNISELMNTTFAQEYHSSGLLAGVQDYIADEQEIRAMAGNMKKPVLRI